MKESCEETEKMGSNLIHYIFLQRNSREKPIDLMISERDTLKTNGDGNSPR